MSGMFFTAARRTALAGSVAALALTPYATARAQTTCGPGDCTHANAGTSLSRDPQPNVRRESAPELGAEGFSISLDGPPAADGQQTRRTIAGAPARPAPLRFATPRLEQTGGVDVTYDGLGAQPRLALATKDLRYSFRAGEVVTFRASSNYPAFIRSAEVIIEDHRGREVARLPVAPNGTVDWVMPGPRATQDDPGEYRYFLRVRDSAGRRDETRLRALTRTQNPLPPVLTGPVYAAGEGEDMTARRAIPVNGGAVTVSGQSVGGSVRIMGEPAPLASGGRFVVQRILPPGQHVVPIQVDGRSLDQSITIQRSEWFGTGIADLTVGRDQEGTWRRGRIAGFAQGTLANGWKLTGSVDTREEELRDMFRWFGRKHPDQTLASMKSNDVFNTFGDDSKAFDLAPTSGKFYLRAEKDSSYLQWGNFRPLSEEHLTVRSERALYGISGEYRAPDVTSRGEARHRVAGFVADADSLMQRDVLRGTGGSAYFLSRQDILSGSEAVYIELRSRTTGLVVERRRLVEDTDYRINPIQGAIFLTSPLSATQQGGGLVSANPTGDYDVNLVVQYEYIPTTGVVDGFTAGMRGETWVSDQLRFGASVLRETTGIADNNLAGADLLWQGEANRRLFLEYATSEGPGFSSRFSINGGLDLDPVLPNAGRRGLRASSWRLSGETDLAPVGLDGEIRAYIDRKDAGFSTLEQSFDYDQTAWGLDGRTALSARTDLTFGGEELKRDDGRRERVARLGFAHRIDAQRMVEAEIANDFHDRQSRTEDFGSRTDAAVRLTWTRDEDLKVWVFGQTTLERDDTRDKNDRLGAGFAMKVTDRTDLLVEGSDGSLGPAGRIELGFRPNDRSRMTLGYELDPMRRYDSVAFRGRDRGNLVFGMTSELNERWSYVTEARYSALGNRPSLAAGYGVTYTPSEVWKLDALIQDGESREEGGFTLKRRGLSLGAKHQQGEELSAGLRAEWHRERSNVPANLYNRDTWLISGHFDVKVSEDWRFVSAIDSQLSKSDQSSFRDGRYIETRFGYAWRPVANDRLNGLISYTYLHDLPGADQVNIDGEVEGPRQKSHILNAALSWKADPLWTIGAKYGYRLRRSADRGSDTYVRSEAHLAVLRADYHVVHNWDIMGEVRGLWTPASGRTETAALLGVYRLFGDHIRVGGGYLHGRVSDDLRKVKSPRTGFFVNLTTQF